MKPFSDYSNTALSDISCFLQEAAFALKPGEEIAFLVLNPDLCTGRYAGEQLLIDGQEYLCRSYRAWNTLAELLGYRTLTPHIHDKHRVLMRFQKLTSARSFHRDSSNGKYSPEGEFAQIRKNEEPTFLYYYRRALKRIGIDHRSRILDLGLHRGDELLPLRDLARENFDEMEIVGVDLAVDALAQAAEKFPKNLTPLCHDINDLSSLGLGRFDLILSIGTLQSPEIEMKPLIMDLVQNHLESDGALLLGWPNSRWIDGELIYGARPPNYSFSELSLVIKDLFWIKKYLQQHRYRVVITGREYLFLEATKIGVGPKASLSNGEWRMENENAELSKLNIQRSTIKNS